MSVASKVLAVETSLKRVVLLSIPDLVGIAALQHDCDVRSLSFSPLGDMLAGGGADDMHGLMRHKTRGSEMKVVIWRITENVSVDMDSLSRVVSKINSPRFHIDRRLSPRGEWWLSGVQHCRKELTARHQPKYSRQVLMAIMGSFCMEVTNDRLQVAENEGASDTCQVSCSLHQLLISEFVCKAEDSMSGVVEYG